MADTSRLNSRRYAILGTGALGGFYGARLQQAGAEVHFLLRGDYEHVCQHGLAVDSPDGNFVLPHVHAYRHVSDMPPCDVVIVALKTTQNNLLPDLLGPVLDENGVVLVLQNGLGIEDRVADIVGAHRVIGGVCFICSNKVGPGHIRHLDYKAIALGEYAPNYESRGISDRMSAIAQDFNRADIPIDLSPDLLLTRWKKLVWNIPFNGLSVVLDATTQEMMANPSSRKLAQQLMGEVADIANAYGRPISDEFVQKMIDHTDAMTPYRTSMKIDYDEHRPLEIEAIVGHPLQLARQAGVAALRIEMLYHQLKFLDERNQ
ncbi:MAG: putative 2-dehydropantoate 2-reductase [Elainellaceae cyanobacterium]